MRDFFAILFRKNRMTVNITQIKQRTADATRLIAFVFVPSLKIPLERGEAPPGEYRGRCFLFSFYI